MNSPQASLQRVLLTRFEEARARNPAFSVRAFAKRLGLSAATVCQVMNGKRTVSRKMLQRIAQRVALDPQEVSELWGETPEPARKKQKRSDGSHVIRYLQLTADQHQVVADATSFAFLNLLETKGFRNDSRWIARRLGISESDLAKTIERLERLGMLVRDGGSYRRSSPHFRTTDDIASISLKRSHDQTLELARASLYYDPVEERDFGWITVPMNSKLLPEVKVMIRKFQDELMAKIEEAGEPDEVYRFSTQLFPLTKKVTDERK